MWQPAKRAGACRVQRIEETSPTAEGSEVPRLSFHVQSPRRLRKKRSVEFGGSAPDIFEQGVKQCHGLWPLALDTRGLCDLTPSAAHHDPMAMDRPVRVTRHSLSMPEATLWEFVSDIHRIRFRFGDLGAGFQEANALDSEASIASDSRSARTRHPRRERPPPTRSTFRDLTPPRRVSQGTEGRPRPTRHRRRPGRCLAGDSLRGIAHAANRDLAAPTAATSSRAPPHRHAASTAPHPPRARDTDRRSRIRRAQCGCA